MVSSSGQDPVVHVHRTGSAAPCELRASKDWTVFQLKRALEERFLVSTVTLTKESDAFVSALR